MGKQNKNGKDLLRRINFLYQAAWQIVIKGGNYNLARHYVVTLRTVALKNVLRLSPTMKRTMCKKCNMLLVPGKTATIRTKSKPAKRMIVTCCDCGSVKCFLHRGRSKLWFEKQLLARNEVVVKEAPSCSKHDC